MMTSQSKSPDSSVKKNFSKTQVYNIMTTPHCPGQDRRFWKPTDIFEVLCPYCGKRIEFWRDDPVRDCPKCQKKVRNPRLDLGCAKWCQFAQECLGIVTDDPLNDTNGH